MFFHEESSITKGGGVPKCNRVEVASYRRNNFTVFTDINSFALYMKIAFYNLQTLTYLKLSSGSYYKVENHG